MMYILLGCTAFVLLPVISYLMFIWGLSAVVNLLAKAEHTEEEEDWG